MFGFHIWSWKSVTFCDVQAWGDQGTGPWLCIPLVFNNQNQPVRLPGTILAPRFCWPLSSSARNRGATFIFPLTHSLPLLNSRQCTLHFLPILGRQGCATLTLWCDSYGCLVGRCSVGVSNCPHLCMVSRTPLRNVGAFWFCIPIPEGFSAHWP